VGQHLATLFGARLATNELIATIDDDGQYPVSAIQEMLMEISKGYDLVYGKPTQGKHGKARDFLSKSFKKISTQSRLIINADKISSQRVFKKQLISNLNDNLPNNFNFDILLLSRTTRVASIPVEIRERNSGVSNYSFNTLVKHSTNMLFSRVDVLSITMFRLGVLGLIISSLTSVVTFVRYFSGAITVPGYSSLILLLGLGLSIILIMQGIVGRMLSLLMNQVMGHRTLWVREELIPSKKEGTKN
jgi:undecaprenyl-phosphate 4-deoxy-4-formamido-L-arabinose transferase